MGDQPQPPIHSRNHTTTATPQMLVGPKPAPKPALEVVAKASELAEETPLLQEMSRTGKAGADTTNGGNGGVNGEGLRKRGAAGAGAAPADAPL